MLYVTPRRSFAMGLPSRSGRTAIQCAHSRNGIDRMSTIDVMRKALANQYGAALATLSACVKSCPDPAWTAPVASYKFCQVVFHTLFYADYYLEIDPANFKRQQFHTRNAAFFRDYEEFEDRAPQWLYERPPTLDYLGHVLAKSAQTIAAETADSLQSACPFQRLALTRLELHLYNIRHIQHHAAGLSLRLRLDQHADIPWIKSGWRDA